MTAEELIVKELLKLEYGEALSINAEDSAFEFARSIALMACQITGYPVKIVVTEKGKPSDVIDIEPEGQFAQPVRGALLHLNSEVELILPDDALDIVAESDDFPVLQRYGHLSEPLSTDRRIAVPWCVVPADAGDDFIDANKAIIADYRKKYLNSLGVSLLEFKDEDSDFVLGVSPSFRFTGGTTVLSSGRRFLSSADFDRLSCTVDCNSIDGTVCGTAVILGRKQDLKLVYKDGELVDFGGNKAFAKLLEFDSMLAKPGYITLRDREICLYLGGGLADGLEGELPESVNTSAYQLRINLGERMNILCTGRDLKRTELVRKGFFLE